jgi:predicted glycogen debranching enzyme
MKLVVKKETLNNLNLASNTEWLEMSQTGCYSCTTIYGMNNRRYHGLFAVPQQSVNQRVILLSKIEESVFIDKRVYELSTNNFVGGIYPEGYKYLDEFKLDPFPTFTFKIEDRRICKTVFLVHDSNILVIRYESKNQGAPLKLILKPLIAARVTSEMAHELPEINTDSYLSERVVKIAPKPNIPELSIYYLKGEYIQAPLWYHDFKYLPEVKGSNNDQSPLIEDLFNPGFFSCRLEAYESFDMFITMDNKIPDMTYDSVYHREKNYRRRYRSKFINLPLHVKNLSKKVQLGRLKLSKDLPYTLQKYHDYTYSTREYLWTLHGLLHIEQNMSRITQFMEEIIENLQEGLLPITYPFAYNPEQETFCAADLPLIFINFTYHYFMVTQDETYLDKVLYDACKEIVDAYQKGTDFDIYNDKDHLLSAGSENINVSGIKIKDGSTRYGKLIELQALWFNALRIMEFFARELKKNRAAKRYAAMAEKTENSFLKKFIDKKNSRFFDVVRENYTDESFRYHHIFTIALPFQLLESDPALLLLKLIEDELLTPFGLRTLSKKHDKYMSPAGVRLSTDDPAYYCGAILPWTIGLYTDAVLQVRGDHQQVVTYMEKILDAFKEIINSESLGYISEVYEGESPAHQNGSQFYPLSLTEYLRAYLTISILKSS